MEHAVETDLALLAGSLEGKLGELVDDYVARLADAVPEWTRDRPQFAQTIRLGALESIGAEVRALARGDLPASCPPFDAEGARQCARLGVPLHAVLQQYRLGHAVQWDAWLRLVDRHAVAGEARSALLAAASRFFFAYADRMTRFAIDEYTLERERLLRGREQRRVALVRDLLEGRAVDAGALGYRPADHHLGLVASGEAAAQTVRELAAASDRRLLLVQADERTCWGWLGGDRPLDDAAQEALRRSRVPAQVRLGLGDQAVGPGGFRRTHRQAAHAHATAMRRGTTLVAHQSVALEAVAGADPEAAREFVTRELRGLDGEDLRSRRLRATLRAYFASGHNAAGAAAMLGIHQQTVAQRLRAVEQRIGCPVVHRRAELETALRLREHLSVPA